MPDGVLPISKGRSRPMAHTHAIKACITLRGGLVWPLVITAGTPQAKRTHRRSTLRGTHGVFVQAAAQHAGRKNDSLAPSRLRLRVQGHAVTCGHGPDSEFWRIFSEGSREASRDRQVSLARALRRPLTRSRSSISYLTATSLSTRHRSGRKQAEECYCSRHHIVQPVLRPEADTGSLAEGSHVYPGPV